MIIVDLAVNVGVQVINSVETFTVVVSTMDNIFGHIHQLLGILDGGVQRFCDGLYKRLENLI